MPANHRVARLTRCTTSGPISPRSSWMRTAHSTMSPAEVAAMLVDIQKAGQKWNLSLLSNMARPGGAWVTDALLGDTEYKGLKEEIRKKFAGPRNAGETAILHGGVKWQSMSMSPYELDW